MRRSSCSKLTTFNFNYKGHQIGLTQFEVDLIDCVGVRELAPRGFFVSFSGFDPNTATYEKLCSVLKQNIVIEKGIQGIIVFFPHHFVNNNLAGKLDVYLTARCGCSIKIFQTDPPQKMLNNNHCPVSVDAFLINDSSQC